MHFKQCKLVITLLLLTFFFSGCSDSNKNSDVPKKAEVELSTGPIAVVNETQITVNELTSELTRIQQRFYSSSKMQNTQVDSLKKEILEILINNELLYQASQALNLSVTDDEIDTDLQKAQEQYPDTENFKNTFTKEDIRKKLLIEKYITTEFSDKTIITDEIAQQYYQTNIDDFTRPEQVLARHILISVNDSNNEKESQKALEKITDIQNQISNGASFSDLADEFSEDPKKMQGGQIGYVIRGQLDPDFEDAAFSLEPEVISDIVHTKYGYHLIKIDEKKELYIFPYDEIAEKLKAFLKQKEIQKKLDTFITTQREQAVIKRNI